VLVLDKNGPKLKESASDAKTSIRFSMGGIKGSLTASKESMTRFALYLSNELGRPVLDKTSLTGIYDFTLQWTRDQNQQIGGGTTPAADSSTVSPDSNAPSMFTAVQEQLGLKLTSQRSLIDILVIEHAARPSEN